MHPLTPVLTLTDGFEPTEPVSESTLATVESYLINADEHAEVRPYIAGEHTGPVTFREPLIVVTGLTIEERAEPYPVHVTGAKYRENSGSSCPLHAVF